VRDGCGFATPRQPIPPSRPATATGAAAHVQTSTTQSWWAGYPGHTHLPVLRSQIPTVRKCYPGPTAGQCLTGHRSSRVRAYWQAPHWCFPIVDWISNSIPNLRPVVNLRLPPAASAESARTARHSRGAGAREDSGSPVGDNGTARQHKASASVRPIPEIAKSVRLPVRWTFRPAPMEVQTASNKGPVSWPDDEAQPTARR
jgi:hypothetical protein